VTPRAAQLRFDSDRVDAFLETLEAMAGGQVDERLPVSSRHDELDAIAHGINVLVGELGWVGARAKEAQEERAAELRATVASVEARNSAILAAIPDLMFILLRDGTYVDYHARDPRLLFAPPGEFIGRKVCDVLPPPLAEAMMSALEHAWQSDDPLVIEYELPMGEPRSYEVRIVRAGADRLLSIVRDITELKRASELNRDLARRLISSQEVERQRIARELHDDISQRIAALKIELDQLATQVGSEQSRARVRKLSAQTSEVATDVHRMSYELHPSKLQTIGLVAALQSLCSDESRLRNLPVAFTHGPMPPSMGAHVSLCLYRIVQEALQNVARHSHAVSAEVSLTCDEGQIALHIADSGVGFDPKHVPHVGLGLVSMRERVAALDGRLAIDAVPGAGTRIAVRIPLVSQGTSPQPPFVAST
jgi:signal transduction histidine kinase